MIIKRQFTQDSKDKALDILFNSGESITIDHHRELGDIYEISKKQLHLLMDNKIKMRIVRTIPKKRKKYGARRVNYTDNTKTTTGGYSDNWNNQKRTTTSALADYHSRDYGHGYGGLI